MSKTYFDMGRQAGRDANDPFGISPIELIKDGKFIDLNWYSIAGHSDRGAAYQLVVSNEGTKLTYYRPAYWTDAEWDEFCNEMEEGVGDQAGDE